MTINVNTKLVYYNNNANISWRGIVLENDKTFDRFIKNDVPRRLNDQNGQLAFESHLHGLFDTGFNNENLEDFLNSKITETRDWAIGEAIAEIWLMQSRNISFPWNNERDKKTPFASLPGADLVGFINENGEVKFVVGEVKSSRENRHPPGVLSGRSGMINQLDILANDLSKMHEIIYYLFPRCKGTDFEEEFNQACKNFISSNFKKVALFGVLIRDTNPDEMDLINRCNSLARKINRLTKCELIALHLPCSIVDLPKIIGGKNETMDN